MVRIKDWMNEFRVRLKDVFADRIWFLGYQGSYGRDEANERSDIDIVVILDEVNPQDIIAYRDLIQSLPERGIMCGFFSGKDEIMRWEPSDLFQFCYDTTSVQGKLDDVLSLVHADDVHRSIRIGLCNLYHGCVHNMLYERSDELLRALYKSTAFVLQAMHFCDTGDYVRAHCDLLARIAREDAELLKRAIELKNGAGVDFQPMSNDLFRWIRAKMRKFAA